MSKKNLLHLLAIMMVAMLSVGFASCGDDDDDDYVPKGGQTTTAPETPSADPEGTITVNLTNDEKSIQLASTSCSIQMNAANNLRVNNYTYSTMTMTIASVGSVSGLSSITKIPESGWTNEIAVVPGQGYVICTYSYDYELHIWQTTPTEIIRLYVTDYMTSTAGGIMGLQAGRE